MAAKKTKASQKRSTKTSQPQKQPQESSPSLSEKQWFQLAIFCAVSSLVLYWNTLSNDFVFDDHAAVVNNPDVRGENSIGTLLKNDFWATPLQDPLSHKSYRPISTLTYRITHLLHTMEPMPFHLVNVVLNAVVCYMSVYVVRDMMCTFTTSNDGWIFPIVTCALFTFHPIHTEVVATVVGRADLLAALFSFASFLLHARVMNTSSNDNNDIMSRDFLYSLICAWLAALSKETGLLVLGINGAHEVAKMLGNKEKNKKTTTSMARFIILASTGVLYLLFRKIINGPSTGILPSAGDNPLIQSQDSLQYFLTTAHIMFIYIWKCIYPFALLCDYGYNVVPLIDGMSDVRNLATLGLLLGVLLLTYMSIRHVQNKSDVRLFMALAWIFIPLLPASHVLILGTVVAERLLFLPSLGYCMLVALGVEYVCMSKRITKQSNKNTNMTILAVVLALYTSRILSRNDDWRTEENLWKADYASHPSNVKISMSRASDLSNAGNNEEAYHIVKDVQGLGDVQYFELCKLKAKTTALSNAGGRDFEKAYQILDECVERIQARPKPSAKDHLVFAAYGYLKSQQELYEDAAEWFHKASEAAEQTGVNPLGSVCNEGEIFARLGKWQDSLPVLQKCAHLSVKGRDWNKDTKLFNLAKALYMTRAFDEAERVLVEDMVQTKETLDFLENVRKTKKKQEEWKRAQEEKQAEEDASGDA